MLELSEKAKELRRSYKREWNARNRDKVYAAQQRYWERKAREAEKAQDAADQAEPLA